MLKCLFPNALSTVPFIIENFRCMKSYLNSNQLMGLICPSIVHLMGLFDNFSLISDCINLRFISFLMFWYRKGRPCWREAGTSRNTLKKHDHCTWNDWKHHWSVQWQDIQSGWNQAWNDWALSCRVLNLIQACQAW